MNSEIRLVEKIEGKVLLAAVDFSTDDETYGDVLEVTTIAEFEDMEKARIFIDSAYRASLTGVVYEIEEGQFV